MSDRRVYDDMARREGEVWSKVLVTRESSEAKVEDQKAAVELRLGRSGLNFLTWCRKNGRTFEKGLSIGCGEGRGERHLLNGGVVGTFHGVDVAEGALDVARKAAHDEGHNTSYGRLDINFGELPEDEYDLIIAQTSLHHVLHLEHAAEQIARALKPGGIFWLHDYIGETQFQFTDDRIAAANRLIASLPDTHRYDRVNKRQLKPVIRREPGTLVSPFESIRSAEIAPIFKSRFRTIEQRETNSLLHLVVPVGTRQSYAETDRGRDLFELIFAMDEICLRAGLLGPTNGQYIFTLQ